MAYGIAQLFCNDTWDYELVIEPDAVLIEKIKLERLRFCKLHDLTITCAEVPQIILAHFQIKTAMEGTMVRWLQNICNLHPGFLICLDNYFSGPPRCIYLQIQDHKPIDNLTNALKILDGFIKANNCPPLRIQNKPHLPLISGLPDEVFTIALKEYGSRNFHASFLANRLFLYKRTAIDQKELINTFVLSQQKHCV